MEDDAIAGSSGVHAHVSVDEDVKREIGNSQISDLVCIEEIPPTEEHSVWIPASLQSTDENVSYIAGKLEITEGLMPDTYGKTMGMAKKDLSVSIPIQVIKDQESQNTEDIPIENLVQQEKAPSVATSTVFNQGKVR